MCAAWVLPGRDLYVEGRITMLNYQTMPGSLRPGTKLYIEQGILPGSFLRAVISNDLKESFAQADDINRLRMFEIVSWFYNEAPAPCWGSPEIMKAWQEAGGLVHFNTPAVGE
jgi:hypothetical protein